MAYLARTAFEVLLVLATGSALGAGLNLFSHHPAALLRPVYPTSASGPASCATTAEGGAGSANTRMMPQAEAIAACAACTAGFVDARGAAAYAHGHLPGAIHLPPVGHPGEEAAIAPLRAFRTVVVYDEGAGCELARGVANRLAALDLPDVRVLDGGWADWQAKGAPAQSGVCADCSASESGVPDVAR